MQDKCPACEARMTAVSDTDEDYELMYCVYCNRWEIVVREDDTDGDKGQREEG